MAFGSQSFINSLRSAGLGQNPSFRLAEGLAGPPIASPPTDKQTRDQYNDYVMGVTQDRAEALTARRNQFAAPTLPRGWDVMSYPEEEERTDATVTPQNMQIGIGQAFGLDDPYTSRAEVNQAIMDAAMSGVTTQEWDANELAKQNAQDAAEYTGGGISGLNYGPGMELGGGYTGGGYGTNMGYGATSGTIGRGAHAGLTSVGPTFGPEGWALDQGSQYSSQPEAVAASIASKGRAAAAQRDYQSIAEAAAEEPGPSDEGTVICTELHRQGLINGDLFRADKKVGETLMRTDPDLMAGYHAWGRPVAKILKKYPVLALIVKPLVLPVIKELAVKEGGSLFGSVIGKAMLFIGAPICRAIGRMRKVDICAQY